MPAFTASTLQEVAAAEAKKVTLEMRTAVLESERVKLSGLLEGLVAGLTSSEEQITSTREEIETLKDEVWLECGLNSQQKACMRSLPLLASASTLASKHKPFALIVDRHLAACSWWRC